MYRTKKTALKAFLFTVGPNLFEEKCNDIRVMGNTILTILLNILLNKKVITDVNDFA